MTYKDLETIRQIRNKFAHTAAPITFEDPKVSEKCATLTREDYSKVIVTPTLPLTFERRSSKGRYIGASQHIALYLVANLLSAPPVRPTLSESLP